MIANNLPRDREVKVRPVVKRKTLTPKRVRVFFRRYKISLRAQQNPLTTNDLIELLIQVIPVS
jgi:hypothetical protein